MVECTITIDTEDKVDSSRESVTETSCDLLKAFNNRLDEMDLSHIDSSESPSEETSPPNPSSSPPPPSDIPPIIPPSPRYIHKSYTEHFLGVPTVSSTVTRSLTSVPTDGNNSGNFVAHNDGLLTVSFRQAEEAMPGNYGEFSWCLNLNKEKKSRII